MKTYKENANPVEKDLGQRILIIDDDAASLGVISDYLRNSGFIALAARSGESGIEKARYAHPDIIFLDVLMPGIDGFETCRCLKSDPATAEIPVIFMTALTGTEDKVKGFEAGAVDYVTKPFQSREVLSRVRMQLRLAALTRELRHTNAELTKHRDRLEEIVEKRTAEIKSANLQLQNEITERKQAEKALRAEHNRFVTVMDTLNTVVYVADMETYELLFMNLHGRRNFGDYIGEKCWSVFQSGQTGPCDFCTNDKLLDADGKPKGPYVWEFQNTVDHEWYECRDEAINWPGGRMVRLETAINVTERKRAEEALKDYSERLEEVVKARTNELEAAHKELVNREKLSVLGRLTAMVSHELRNPLGVIRSSAYYLNKRLGNADEKTRKHLDRIEQQVGHCDFIVDELLEYTRGRRSEMNKGELNQWLEGALDQIEIPDQVRLDYEPSPDTPIFHFDREKMRRVIINLVENALQAVIARQERIKKEDVPYAPLVKVSTSITDNGVCIEVEDNGPGMDNKIIRRAFEPLFTTRARGTGLGLAIVKKIVVEHNGRVELSSKPERGTKAIVVIPVAE